MRRNLMTSRRFAPLFWTQFLAAFNDNFLKNTLVFLILARMAANEAAPLITLSGAVFMAPFLLFSALGGQLADKYDKAMVAEKLKRAEMPVAALAVLGLGLGSVWLLMLSLFLFGVNSALFGPLKYGILPDQLEPEDVLRANAWVEGATFIAILTGTIAAGVVAIDGVSVRIFGPAMIGLALACWLASRLIPAVPARAPELAVDWNVLRSTRSLVAGLKSERRIWNAALMVSWFWLVGAIILSLLPPLVKHALGGGEAAITFYLAIFAIAVGLGSALAARACAGRMTLTYAPWATAAIGLFCLDLAWCVASAAPGETSVPLIAFLGQPGVWRVAFDLSGLAIAGSFLVVPAFAALQVWARQTHRARAVGATNVLSAAFMTFGGGAVAAIQGLGVSIPLLLAALAILNGAAAAWMRQRTATA